jgi:hypothetical protein
MARGGQLGEEERSGVRECSSVVFYRRLGALVWSSGACSRGGDAHALRTDRQTPQLGPSGDVWVSAMRAVREPQGASSGGVWPRHTCLGTRGLGREAGRAQTPRRAGAPRSARARGVWRATSRRGQQS